jgi:WXG100 family type VII secretion target
MAPTPPASGGGNGTNVDLDVLQQAAVDVRQQNTDIQAQLKALQSKLQTGLNSGAFYGDTAAAFWDVHGRWDADALQLYNSLNTIADLLEKNHLQYRANQHRQTTKIRGLGTTLNPGPR